MVRKLRLSLIGIFPGIFVIILGLATNEFTHLGCFTDSISQRALPIYLGRVSTIQQCSDLAGQRDYVIFGIQWFVECWSGPDGENTYDRHGRSSICIAGKGFANAFNAYRHKQVCRSMNFDPFISPNMALKHHVIQTHVTESEQRCRIKCYLNHDCVSYNLGPSSTPGMMVCQLNDADRYQYPQDYQDTPGYFYRGTENACRSNPCVANTTCQAGFGLEKYRCI